MINRFLNKWIDFVKDHIYIITILIFVSLVGLLLVQYHLIKLEVDIQQHNFNEEIDDVLLDMHHRIEDDELLSNQVIDLIGNKVKPVSKKDSIETALTDEIRHFTDSIMTKRGVGFLDYDFAFYQRYEDTIVFASAKEIKQPDVQEYSIKAGWRIKEMYGEGVFRFGLVFHNKSLYILYQIYSILIITIILIVILLGSFFSTFLVLKKQKQLSELKTDFINNLTHELKTPIFASSIIYKIIKKKYSEFSESELKYNLALLEKENHLLKSKIEKVLELTDLERTNPDVKLVVMDLHETIRQKKEIYKLIIESASGTLSCNLEASDFLILGDSVHIASIIDNLLDNAIKYSENGPKISISTSNSEGEIILKITDKGIGVEEKNLPYIFDKFYRVSHGDLHNIKGFGLGLSYVKMMTEIHGGKINFQSKKNQGSTVTIIFPVYTNNKINIDESSNLIGRR
ncbi:sensor histidine kinase [Autumnicola psychrophila]|uniref:histidine kinase n=1 Tax=Autumnicola psychrophila TaxID=3075592 RepID=A0ABU3DTD0_9FLAO|nr:HAMP domain-containing sensor histidine kinase [Zunongwangia sp. F225]MDT0686966.1 HAMP domain-containing sensor histidine kinase [Zunongwangia sp. F225]